MVRAGKLKDDNRNFVKGFRDDFEYGKSSKVILEIEEIKWKEHKRWIENVR